MRVYLVSLRLERQELPQRQVKDVNECSSFVYIMNIMSRYYVTIWDESDHIWSGTE